MTTFYKVYKDAKYKDIGNKRINVGAVKIEPQYYKDDIEMILDLNRINNMEKRLNVDYIFTDLNKACEYTKELIGDEE